MFRWPRAPYGGDVWGKKSESCRSGQRAGVIGGTVVFIALFIPFAVSASPADPAETFQVHCSACHTVGQGDRVGPDLYGVDGRRDIAWLTAFIRSSQSVIASGDPIATDLFERFGQRTMPDHDLENAEIEALIAFIADGGPDTAPAFLAAASAAESDVAEGRMIFFNRRSASATACASCHSLRNHEGRFTQSLGGSLGHVFTRYQDAELARQLQIAVTQSVNGNCRRVPLDAEEAFFLRAFLYRVDQQSITAEASPLSLPKAGLATALGLFLAVQLGSGWRLNLRLGRRRLTHLDPLA